MQRGEVWWASLDEPEGVRPVVLISRDKAIQVRDLVTVIQVTTNIRGLQAEVRLDQTDGMPKTCVANCDVLKTIPKKLIKKKITHLSHKKMEELNHAISFSLGLNE